jgi:SpoIID/LytB domain protein
VVQSASTITLGSTADYTITAKNSGAVLMSGSHSSANVTVSGAVARWRLQVVCASEATVNARIAQAQALGHVTHTEPIAACIRLYLGDFPSNAPFAERNAYRNLVISQGLAATDAFYRSIVVSQVSYTVTRGTTSVVSVEPVVITSSNGRVTINGSVFRDKGEAIINSSGTLAGVNDLPIEQYLYGVVPRELGPIAFPELEAQKAQAIAARTYALSGLGKRGHDGYDLRATTDDQVYGGFIAEHPISSAAVDATAAIVLTYEGKLIQALYSSASGGHTADNEEAFNSNAVLYLRGVPDSERGQALDHVPSIEVFRAHGNPTSLRNVRESDFESDWSRFHRWTFEWTNEQISSVISTFAQQPVGKVLAINVLGRGPSGRVTSIEYVTENGTFTHTRDAIRSSLKFINASGVATSLPSTLFFIEPIHDKQTQELQGFRVYGGGFGHGVGMAQTGAVGMAQKKHTYEEILRHYYRDVDLTAAY